MEEEFENVEIPNVKLEGFKDHSVLLHHLRDNFR